MGLFGPDKYPRERVPELKEQGFDGPALYCLWYIDKNTKKRQYIGETHCLCNRLAQHDRNWSPYKWNHFSFTKAPSSKSRRKEKEIKAIKKYNPPYNDLNNK